VPEQEGEVVVDATVAIVQVGVADTAGLHLHECLTRSRVRHDHRLQRHRPALGHGHDTLHLVRHAVLSRERATDEQTVEP
jgi:hypothetical protein